MFFRKISVVLLILSIKNVWMHGRLEEPASRNAAWRLGFNVPANYDDVGLNCGGLSVQRANGGKCGICGDPFNQNREHEAGGKFATNTIVRSYRSGSMMDISVLLSANHRGFMEIRICPALNDRVEVTQQCLDQNLLYIDGFGFQFIVEEGMDRVHFRAKIPDGFSCDRCVVQWRYHAGNNWGRSLENSLSCLGCGDQEEFYNCADVRIENGPSISLFQPTIVEEKLKNPSVFSFRFDEPKISLRCFSTNELLKPLAGIEDWCRKLCRISCPPTLCACV